MKFLWGQILLICHFTSILIVNIFLIVIQNGLLWSLLEERISVIGSHDYLRNGGFVHYGCRIALNQVLVYQLCRITVVYLFI